MPPKKSRFYRKLILACDLSRLLFIARTSEYGVVKSFYSDFAGADDGGYEIERNLNGI